MAFWSVRRAASGLRHEERGCTEPRNLFATETERGCPKGASRGCHPHPHLQPTHLRSADGHDFPSERQATAASWVAVPSSRASGRLPAFVLYSWMGRRRASARRHDIGLCQWNILQCGSQTPRRSTRCPILDASAIAGTTRGKSAALVTYRRRTRLRGWTIHRFLTSIDHDFGAALPVATGRHAPTRIDAPRAGRRSTLAARPLVHCADDGASRVPCLRRTSEPALGREQQSRRRRLLPPLRDRIADVFIQGRRRKPDLLRRAGPRPRADVLLRRHRVRLRPQREPLFE